MLLPGELKEIHEVAAFLRQELSLHPENMSFKEQERIAAGIVGLGVSDLFDDWRRDYPSLGKIYDIATDLEWSNVDSAPISWQEIERLTDELLHEIA